MSFASIHLHALFFMPCSGCISTSKANQSSAPCTASVTASAAVTWVLGSWSGFMRLIAPGFLSPCNTVHWHSTPKDQSISPQLCLKCFGLDGVSFFLFGWIFPCGQSGINQYHHSCAQLCSSVLDASSVLIQLQIHCFHMQEKACTLQLEQQEAGCSVSQVVLTCNS